MNLINIMLDKSGMPPNGICMGCLLGLWNIINNKIITLPEYIIYSKQAKDKELLGFINARINTVKKQIGSIQQFMKERNFEVPKEPNWDKKMNNEPFMLSSSILDDEEIAMGMKEHLKAVLGLETEALRNTTIPEGRKLIFSIIKTGQADYSSLIKLMREKNWMDTPPIAIQQ